MITGIILTVVAGAAQEKLSIDDYMRPFRDAFSSYVSVVSDAEELYYEKDYTSAWKKYNAILKGAEKSDYKKIAYVGMGWCYLGLGKFSDAIKMFKQADVYAAQDPKAHIMTLMGNGIAYFNKQDYPEAFRFFGRITEDYREYRDPWKDAYYFKGLAAYAKGDYDNAIKALDTVINNQYFEGYERKADAYLYAAKSAVGNNDYKKASKYLSEFSEEFPGHPKIGEANLLLAESQAAQGDYAGAISTYETLLNTYPYLKDAALESMARVSNKYGDYLVGDTSFKITHPLMVDVFLWVPAVEAQKAGRLEKAMPRFMRMARDVPGDERSAKGLALIGQAFADQGSYTKAIEIFHQYIVQYPGGQDLPTVMNLLATCYMKTSQWREALRVLDEIVYRFSYDDSQAATVEGAKKKISAILAEHPDAAEGLSFKTPGLSQDAAFQQATAAYNQGDYTRSAQLYLDYAKANPGDAKACKAVFNAGYIYFQVKDYKNAVSALGSYVSGCATGEDAENAYFYLGACYYFAEDYASSIKTLDAFTGAYPASSYKPNALKLVGLAYLELATDNEAYKEKGIEYLKEAARVFRAHGNPSEAEKIETYLKQIGAM